MAALVNSGGPVPCSEPRLSGLNSASPTHQLLLAAMPPNVLRQKARGRLQPRHAGNVRHHTQLGRPERVGWRQRVRVRDIQDRAGEQAGVQRSPQDSRNQPACRRW
jgi:hypothetical protein